MGPESAWRLDDYRPLLSLQARQVRLHPGLRARLEASDLVQDTLLRAHAGLDGFRGTTEAELLQWLKAILERVTIDAIRRETAQARDPALERRLRDAVQSSTASWDGVLPDPADTPVEAAQKREWLERLASALERLPEDQRDAVTARDLLGLSIDEVAERMGRSADSVAGLLRRGRRLLRELLGESAGGPDAG